MQKIQRVVCCFFWVSTAAMGEVPAQTRASIDHITGIKGTYNAEEGVYKLVFPREDLKIMVGPQQLLPQLGANSWVAFVSSIHHEALLTGEFTLLEDEVNSALTAALNSGLDVTGLGSPFLFERPPVLALEVSGIGGFQKLASSVRKVLDEIKRVRASKRENVFMGPRAPETNAISAAPIDRILSMRGTVSAGIYKAAIGRRAALHGETIGREMGMTTWISFAGENDHSITNGEFVASVDELQRLLNALRARNVNITSIRNHTVGEHPQFVFVHFWAQGPAIELAKALRYALDVQVGAVPARSGDKI